MSIRTLLAIGRHLDGAGRVAVVQARGRAGAPAVAVAVAVVIEGLVVDLVEAALAPAFNSPAHGHGRWGRRVGSVHVRRRPVLFGCRALAKRHGMGQGGLEEVSIP